MPRQPENVKRPTRRDRKTNLTPRQASDRQIKVAYLRSPGQRARHSYAVFVRDVEADQAVRFGPPAVSAVRESLEATLPALDPELPDAP